ncbi:MAG: BrnT family toxin [Syntrophobacteraceae bacterium]
MLEFEWDNDKAAMNRRDHGVAFQQTVKAFSGHFAVEWIDDRGNGGGERVGLVGMCGRVIPHVAYTELDERIRIISARRAEKHEQEYHYRENSL